MQISVLIDSDKKRNGQSPKILGAIGHPRHNEFSVLKNFVLTGFHCIAMKTSHNWTLWIQAATFVVHDVKYCL